MEDLRKNFVNEFELMSRVLYMLKSYCFYLNFDKLRKYREDMCMELSDPDSVTVYDVLEKLAYDIEFTDEQKEFIIKYDFEDNVSRKEIADIVIEKADEFLKTI